MGFWKKTGRVLGHAVDCRVDRWMDLKELKRTTLYFWNQGKRLFKPSSTTQPETFEEAVKRLQLNAESLQQQKKRYQYLCIFFLVMAAALLIYMSIIAKLGNLKGATICFALALYALSHAFRFHFWCFQITQKKLGCKGREWLAHTIPFIKSTKR